MRATTCAALLLAACAGPPPAPIPVSAPAADAPPPETTTSIASPAPSASAANAPAPVQPPTIELGSWKAELSEPTVSIAIGQRRVAALSLVGVDPLVVWMRDAGTWKKLPFPKTLFPQKGQHDALSVYFGRDDRPRVMGFRNVGIETQRRFDFQQLYYRWKGNWRAKSGEIGRLMQKPPAALFGILGHDDPEVVCKLGDECIIKRLTGWTMVPSPQVLHHVAIAGGSAFAVGANSALRIDDKDKAWRKISDTVPWKEASGLWASPNGMLWVCSGEQVHHWDRTRWTSVRVPLKVTRGIWGRAPDDIWIVGRDGVAHHDGDRWRKLRTPIGAFEDVTGTADETWVAGRSGVWVGTR